MHYLLIFYFHFSVPIRTLVQLKSAQSHQCQRFVPGEINSGFVGDTQSLTGSRKSLSLQPVMMMPHGPPGPPGPPGPMPPPLMGGGGDLGPDAYGEFGRMRPGPGSPPGYARTMTPGGQNIQNFQLWKNIFFPFFRFSEFKTKLPNHLNETFSSDDHLCNLRTSAWNIYTVLSTFETRNFCSYNPPCFFCLQKIVIFVQMNKKRINIVWRLSERPFHFSVSEIITHQHSNYPPLLSFVLFLQ